jgi:chorismate mutase-like protein
VISSLARATARAVALALFFAAAASDDADSGPAPDRSIVDLKDTIAGRLLLMDDVARYKWNAELPVLDPVREASLLERTTDSAVAIGIPRDYARRVVAAQIEASRDTQQTAIDRWRAERHGAFPDVPDLVTVQRPAIEQATAALLTNLRDAMCKLGGEARNALSTPPPTLAAAERAWSIAVDALWPPPDTCQRDESARDRAASSAN